MARLKVQPRFQRDARGMRARIGDTVWFQLDPDKPHKPQSEAVITRWIAPRVVEVRYTDTGYDGTKGPHYFDLASSEFVVARHGKLAAKIEQRIEARIASQEESW